MIFSKHNRAIIRTNVTGLISYLGYDVRKYAQVHKITFFRTDKVMFFYLFEYPEHTGRPQACTEKTTLQS